MLAFEQAFGKLSCETYVARARDTLHLHLEVVDVLRLKDQGQNRRGVGKALVDGIDKVALETSRVVVQRIAGWRRDGDTSGCRQSHGPKVDGHVLERARLDTSSSITGGKVEGRQIRRSTEGNVARVVCVDGGAIAAHRSLASIEDGAGGKPSVGRLRPVPVRLVAFVATLLTESFLVQPRVVPVPREEVGRVVDGQGLVDVGGDEVIEAGLRTRSHGRRGECWLLL